MKNYASLIRVIFCLGILILLGFKGQAQETRTGQVRNLNGGPLIRYQNSVGIRLGTQSGLTLKHFMREGNALEGILSTHYDHQGIVGTILYEWHRNAFESKKFIWYFGGGGHVGYYKYSHYYKPNNNRFYKSGSFVEVGADGIVGIEYGFLSTPITISVDGKPYVNFIGGKPAGVDAAVSIRYIF